jgi:CheY-like chemotaxis protein
MAGMLIDCFHLDDRYEHDDRSEVESVAYCDDALALLERRRFDLVLILSLHVPWKTLPSSSSATRRIDFANAILLLKHLRALHSSPPVILMSGSPLAEAKEEALANGAFAFLPKPVDLAELDRFVVVALESRKAKR